MSRKNITAESKKIILREKKKFPYLGVRALSSLLKIKYQIDLSKSTIHKIFKSKGLRDKFGRKESLSLYQNKNKISNCGLILLQALDSQIGLLEHLISELKTYFPKLDYDFLKKFLVLAVFSSLNNKALSESLKEKGFLRLVGLKNIPLNKINYFENILSQQKIVINLNKVKENVQLASTIKFYFKNGYEGYLDAKMSTFWDKPCNLEYFYIPLKAAIKKVEQALADKILIIGYTKSFGYLSPLVFDYLRGVESGIKKIQFLNGEGRILAEQPLNQAQPKFAVGYYPKIIPQGVLILNQHRYFRRLHWEEIGEFYTQITIAKLLQQKDKKGVILNNVLIRKNPVLSPTWGIFTNFNIGAKFKSLPFLVKKYLYLWPYLDKGFSEEMSILEKAFTLKSKKKEYLSRILPQKLTFKNPKDFILVGEILSVIFKELIGGWEPKEKSGNFVIGKEYVKVFLKIPLEVKKNFNKNSLYINNKRVFIL
ncbi:MAG: hypothetical protein KBB01_00535 [Candidatus Omnitrophica bacterium]|jgi:hypothetical protein|nr:hypothetical protein [Candidatus Omnitrophota bacterium]